MVFSAFGGHFGLSLDATGHNFPDTPAWRLLEFKTANDKSFKERLKKGVKELEPAILRPGDCWHGIIRA